MKPGFHFIVEASTAHITKEDDAIIQNPDRYPFGVHDHDQGYFLDCRRFSEERVAELQQAGMSDAFIELYRYAGEGGATYLHLDVGAEVLYGFEVFTW